MNDIVISFGDGRMRFIYTDALAPLLSEGDFTVTRASHVEPTTVNGHVEWTADMSPVGGPVLTGFQTRQAALDAEVLWLRENRGL